MTIREAKTIADFEQVAKVRYSVNLRELGKTYLSQDDAKRDEQSVVLLAENQFGIVGTVRCLFLQYCEEIKIEWGLSMPITRSKIGLVDRLAILPDFRHSRVTYGLVTQIYRQALLEGTYLSLLECEGHLLGFYEHLGFKVYRELERSYGKRFQLYINPRDETHLISVKSPFVKEYRKFEEELNQFISLQNTSNSA